MIAVILLVCFLYVFCTKDNEKQQRENDILRYKVAFYEKDYATCEKLNALYI